MTTENRPWGVMETFFHEDSPHEQMQSWVKILTIKPKEAISLQKHKYRFEKWYILKGNPKIQIGESIRYPNPGEFLSVGRNVLHRIWAREQEVKILEICFGTKVSEDDIVRYADKYGRVTLNGG